MTPDDAKQLLARCAAFDNRQPSIIAAQAWAAALHDIPADPDAFAAIARYYGTPPKNPGDRLWIQPHDVRTLRQTIRDQRLEGFVYEPTSSNETPGQYLANLRAQREAVASGHRPANPAAAALEGGPHPSVAAILSGVARTVPTTEPTTPEPDPDASPLSIPCPTCGARLGHHCRWGNGRRRPTHGTRKRAARGEPIVTPGTEQEAANRRAAAAAYLQQLDPAERDRLDAFQAQLRDTEAN